MLGGVRVIVIPDHQVEQDHVACTLPIVQSHRFWFGLNLAFGWPNQRYLYATVPGWSRPVYRPKPVSYLMPNGVMAVSRTVYETIRREIPVMHSSPPGLFR